MTIKDILNYLDESGIQYSFSGEQERTINSFSSLSRYKQNSITWIKKEDAYNEANRPEYIACAIVEKRVLVEFCNAIFVDNSKEVFFKVLKHFWGNEKQEGFIGEGTIISKEASIDPTAYIGYNCSIVGNVQIGAHTVIENNVSITGNVVIGCNSYVQSGAVIGIDGFGYSTNSETGKRTMVEHFGGVVIGNDVFIGSHVNIARGTIDDTVIMDGVKISPSTHIGHNNIVGKNTTIICSNMFGSVHTGNKSYVTASTVQNQMHIGNHTVIGMGSVVNKPIGDDVIAFGIPAKVVKENNSDL